MKTSEHGDGKVDTEKLNWGYDTWNLFLSKFALFCFDVITFVKIHCVYTCIFNMKSSKSGPGFRPWICEKMDSLKNKPVRKAGCQGLSATLPLISCHMKDNFKEIRFYTKSRSVQGFIFVQITFGIYTTNFYFENGEVCIKTTITDLQPLLV